jgi:hypothetical protein
MRETLNTYLRKYYEFQPKILLCYRPTERSDWKDRCFYLEDNYDSLKKYNHRGILGNEVVIEFDEEDKEVNAKLADEVCLRLQKDNIRYAKWYTGGKSVHIHILLDVGEASNIRLLKTVFTRHYTEGLDKLPDLQMTYPNHLIRAEFGIHEKTGREKMLLYKSRNYFKPCFLPQVVWDKYTDSMAKVVKTKLTKDIKNFNDLPSIQLLFKTEEIAKVNDGRERSLLLLIKVLRSKYSKEELIKYLQDWYKYTKGTKLQDKQIAGKVYYYWNKEYSFNWWVQYLNDLLIDIGREDMIVSVEEATK